MRVAEARKLMLKHCISINDVKQRKNLPVIPSAVTSYFTGKGARRIPDALARVIEEMVRDRTTADY